jgi:hypothetical protein
MLSLGRHQRERRGAVLSVVRVLLVAVSDRCRLFRGARLGPGEPPGWQRPPGRARYAGCPAGANHLRPWGHMGSVGRIITEVVRAAACAPRRAITSYYARAVQAW